METPRNLVTAVTELPTGVEDGKDRFKRGFAGLLLDIDRDPPPVVGHDDRVIRFNNYVDFITKTGQGFVNPVVDDFPHQVVQSLDGGGTNVHTGPLTHGL